MVHLMPSLTYLTVTGSQKPLEEPSLSVLPFLAPECLVESEIYGATFVDSQSLDVAVGVCGCNELVTLQEARRSRYLRSR